MRHRRLKHQWAHRLTTACSRRPSQSSNLHAQIGRLSGARLILAVVRSHDYQERQHGEEARGDVR
jgi:hypothetical protein